MIFYHLFLFHLANRETPFCVLYFFKVDGALKLLQAAFRANVEFETDLLSHLISDFATSSSRGLQSALSIRDTMKEKGLLVGTVGLTGIMAGSIEHGLTGRRFYNSTLLVGEADRARVTKEELARRDFFLSSAKACSLAYEILDEHFEREKKKPPKKLISEIVRLLFNVRY
jgi:hypothetical protein